MNSHFPASHCLHQTFSQNTTPWTLPMLAIHYVVASTAAWYSIIRNIILYMSLFPNDDIQDVTIIQLLQNWCNNPFHTLFLTRSCIFIGHIPQSGTLKSKVRQAFCYFPRPGQSAPPEWYSCVLPPAMDQNGCSNPQPHQKCVVKDLDLFPI